MKRAIILTPILLIALALGFVACKKDTNTTSGDSTLGIKIMALNKSYSLPVNTDGTKSSSATASSIAWDTARMIVSRVKYEAELKSLITHRDSIRIGFEWNGPLEINLFDTSISIGNFSLQPGFYDEIELKVEGLKHDAGNKPVFYLHGMYTNDTSSVPVIVTVNENVLFKTEKDSVEVTSSDPSVFTSSIQLYLDQLLAGIQPSALDNATLTNGAIVISAEINTEIYRLIMRNLGRNHPCGHHHHHGNGHGQGH
jgi:hypothetical protein